MGFLSDILGGKEKKIKADSLAGDINRAGKSGLGMMQTGADALNAKVYNNPENYVDNQIATENKLLRSASDDAARRTRQLIAQRGMGSSSIGLGQEVNQARSLSDRLALNNASGMDRLKGLYQEKMNTGAQLFGVKQSQGPIQMQTVKYRSGGLGGLIGAGIGGALGGAPGAQVGAGVGQSLGQM